VSDSAITSARKLQIDRSAFLATDCESYTPTESFDVMVFNEVLYCVRDPLTMIGRYSRSLRDGGVLLVSMCTAARSAGAILKRLRVEFSVIDEIRVTHGKTRISWDCAALRSKTAVGEQ
jgi:trans-aconitate methyltransferase